MEFLVYRIPTVTAGVVALALAGWVFTTRPHHRLHQAFALMFLCTAWARISLGWSGGWTAIGTRLSLYGFMAFVPAGLYFAYRFALAHRPNSRRLPWFGPAMIALVAAQWTWFIARPEAFLQPPWHYIRWAYAFYLLHGVLGLTAALTALRSTGSHRRSLKMIAAGLSIEAAYGGGTFARTALDLTLGSWSLFDSLVHLGSVLTTIATIVLLAWPLRSTMPCAMVGTALVAGLVMSWVRTFAPVGAILGLSIAAFWSVLGAATIAYGLVHCRVFTIDLRLKQTVKQAAVVSSLTVLFLVLGETIESFIPSPGAWSAVSAGVVVALVFHPIERMSRRMTERLWPNVEASPEYDERRRTELYAAALEEAIIDGRLTEDEELHLIGLQRSLGITTARATRLERRILDGRTISEYRAV